MKLFSVSLALAACLSMAAAQGLDGLPDCAKSCATNSIPARCGFDVKCICTDSSFISGISCCVLQSCAADQQQEDAHPFFPAAAVEFANRICRTAGVTNMPQSPSCANATQSATGTPSGSSTSTSSSSTESNASQTAATATTSTTTSSTTGSATSSAASATNSSTGAAVAQHKDTGLIALAGAALAAFGLLA
ncbi:GPI anchored CFEM domain protein C [Aspergillus lentulus]|uniref:GPI anchored CFEM domain protein C n=1 Tax=Aspergillus lentulus TaxID=293939 RepID=A0AAN4T776_ASPLE|nr:hypothetical protein CNMCM6069_007149 [Aspergillus lentulus]KAF4168721.1 hypothetical protein CNMCM6936_001141 [Aspergillus lentulus]KAF4181283.1 hypothetical protein CNMCM8060_009232 [Aspergillus lentulus]KAF4186405.1 hypothetical protein CNMCM7927_005504 [Aspergillus lentulus]KAF4198383.1 hypothetical protein CNMCM8694_009719 [Aspergillus lentulus]